MALHRRFRHFLLTSDEKVDVEPPLDMLPNIPAVRALLSRSILTLPLELVSADKVVLVLEL